MKKNIKPLLITLFIVIIIGLVIVLGYPRPENENEDIPVVETEQSIISESMYENIVEQNIVPITVSGLNLKFTETDMFYNFVYKYPRGTIVNSLEETTTLSYLKGVNADELIFTIYLDKMKYNNYEQIIKNNNYIKNGNKTINSINWDVYRGNNGEIIYTYIDDIGDVYMIKFISEKNINDVEKEFMNNVHKNN